MQDRGCSTSPEQCDIETAEQYGSQFVDEFIYAYFMKSIFYVLYFLFSYFCTKNCPFNLAYLHVIIFARCSIRSNNRKYLYFQHNWRIRVRKLFCRDTFHPLSRIIVLNLEQKNI